MSLSNNYVFETDYHSNKIAIKNAFEFLFSVRVESVRTKIVNPKARRVGRFAGYKKRQKHAYFQLAPGQKLDIFQKSQGIQKGVEGKDISKIDKIKDALFNVTKGSSGEQKAQSKQAFLQKAFEILKKKKKGDLSESANKIKFAKSNKNEAKASHAKVRNKIPKNK